MGTNKTLSEIRSQANVSKKEFCDGLKVSMRKANIVLKRYPSDFFVNAYNPVLLKYTRANMDIQCIFDVRACVEYIISFMCKPAKKNIFDSMRYNCKEAATLKNKLVY